MRIFSTALILVFLAGCAKDTSDLVTPETPDAILPDSESQRLENTTNTGELEFTTETKTADTAGIIIAEKPEEADEPEKTEMIPATPVEIVPEPQPVEEIEPVIESVTITPPIPKPEVVFADSSFESYMIKRDDWLSKIAQKEYGDWLMWKKIYQWNKETIGPNPNLIYPYNFLDLLKPADQVKKCEVEFYDYTISSGETLWSIAGKIFGDELVWIILYMDNEEIFEGNAGEVEPGMIIKLRKKLDPCG